MRNFKVFKDKSGEYIKQDADTGERLELDEKDLTVIGVFELISEKLPYYFELGDVIQMLYCEGWLRKPEGGGVDVPITDRNNNKADADTV